MPRRIKVDADILESIELSDISHTLGISTEDVFIVCFRFWSWCDNHTVDGIIPCGGEMIDMIAEHDGFASALEAVGWLCLGESESTIPDYNNEHGCSSKKRQKLATERSPVGVIRRPVDLSLPDRQNGVYCIRHVATDRRYIGSTARTFKKRWEGHRSELRAKRHHSHKLQAAWLEFGEDAFLFEIVEVCESDILEREQHWIDLHDAANTGFNVLRSVNPRRGS